MPNGQFVLLILTVGLLAAACSPAQAPETTPEAGLTVEVVLDADPRLRSRLLLERELEFQDLIATCMRVEGFEYFPIDDSVEVAAATEAFERDQDDGGVDHRTGLVSESYAAEHGFGLVDLLTPIDRRSPFERPINLNEDYVDQLSPEEASAYSKALGACEDSAGVEAGFDSVYSLFDTAEDVAMAVEERLEADGALQRLTASWSACYVDSGAWHDEFPESPLHLYVQVADMVFESSEGAEDASSWNSGEVADIERKSASTSARCAAELGYRDTLTATYDAYLQQELASRGLD